MIDFSKIDRVTFKMADLQRLYTREDVIAATNEMVNTLIDLVSGLPDSFVTFEPDDPDAYDGAAAAPAEITMPWTLGHVIVHITATSEERAAQGSYLARGVQIEGRSRYEVPWQTMQTTAQLVARLEDSRRIRLAYLNAWGDHPQLENVFTKSDRAGLVNAVGYTLLGLSHEVDHLDQIKDIIRQAHEALTVNAG